MRGKDDPIRDLPGALDGGGDADNGFIIRGGRMHEKHFVCYWDLLSSIPSYDDPEVSVKSESFEFSSRYVSHAQARLLKDGKIIGGPINAIKKHAEKFVTLEVGKEKKSDVAKKIKFILKGDLDDIMKFLPSGFFK